MKNKEKLTRRNFVKTGLASGAGIAGAASLSSFSSGENKLENEIPVFQGNGWQAADGPAGMLFSQVGYELGWPVRVIVRLPKKELLPKNANCMLILSENENSFETYFE